MEVRPRSLCVTLLLTILTFQSLRLGQPSVLHFRSLRKWATSSISPYVPPSETVNVTGRRIGILETRKGMRGSEMYASCPLPLTLTLLSCSSRTSMTVTVSLFPPIRLYETESVTLLLIFLLAPPGSHLRQHSVLVMAVAQIQGR